jgi:hypothetical protein
MKSGLVPFRSVLFVDKCYELFDPSKLTVSLLPEDEMLYCQQGLSHAAL